MSRLQALYGAHCPLSTHLDCCTADDFHIALAECRVVVITAKQPLAAQLRLWCQLLPQGGVWYLMRGKVLQEESFQLRKGKLHHENINMCSLYDNGKSDMEG